SREMRAEGSWLVPQLNGTPFLEEPPLFYWLQAGAYRLAGGPSAAAARWPATVAAVLGVLVTMALARAVGASAGIAGLILATAPEYWWMARSGTPDTAAASATTLALTLFFLAWRSGRRSPLAVAAVAAGTAFWLKSLLGVGLASITVAAFLAWVGKGRLRTRDLVWAAVATGSGAALWLVLLWRAHGGEPVAFFFLKNHLGRLVGAPEEGHLRSVLYYVPNLALRLLLLSLEPNVVTGMVETGSDHPMTLARELLQAPTGAASWGAALFLVLLGLGFLAARRARKPAQAAVAVAACATALHLFIVI